MDPVLHKNYANLKPLYMVHYTVTPLVALVVVGL
jgi:hypothetical protein